ncbi:MAG TPA: hypothetical protein VHB48_00950, partial [Chitinophagaceae bacterium]|nr:hypothetical protein [Chitinophagaceae bacterium]
MTFLQALYGSQYREISQKGKDGAKGRLNGNLFLCAFILLIVFTIITSILTFYPSSNNAFTKAIRKIYPFESGKMIAFELTPPVFGLLYLFVANTVGSIANFNRLIA